jgi:hypothetical protein
VQWSLPLVALPRIKATRDCCHHGLQYACSLTLCMHFGVSDSAQFWWCEFHQSVGVVWLWPPTSPIPSDVVHMWQPLLGGVV